MVVPKKASFVLLPGDIFLFRSEENILSRLIAWGTDSVYSHVAVCVCPDMNLAIEAMTRGGVRARDIRRITAPYDVYRVRADCSYDLTDTISYLVGALNSRYDYCGVLFLGILKLLARLRFPLRAAANAWQKDRDYFCSELCYEAFAIGGGLDIVPQVPAADITSPCDISCSTVLMKVSEEERIT